MNPGKQYRLCCVLSCNYVGYNVVASSGMLSTFWRVSRDYQGLLSSRNGYRALASLSLPSSASLSFQASQFSTSQLLAEKRKEKLPGPRAAGTSPQDLFKQDLQSTSPFNIDPSYVAFFLQTLSSLRIPYPYCNALVARDTSGSGIFFSVIGSVCCGCTEFYSGE